MHPPAPTSSLVAWKHTTSLPLLEAGWHHCCSALLLSCFSISLEPMISIQIKLRPQTFWYFQAILIMSLIFQCVIYSNISQSTKRSLYAGFISSIAEIQPPGSSGCTVVHSDITQRSGAEKAELKSQERPFMVGKTLLNCVFLPSGAGVMLLFLQKLMKNWLLPSAVKALVLPIMGKATY